MFFPRNLRSINTILGRLGRLCKVLIKKCIQLGIIKLSMYRRSSKKQQLIKRIFVYAAMILLVAITVTGLIFVILGYRIDTNNGQVERSALLQYKTTPSGASVSIDGVDTGMHTPAENTVLEGTHKFVMQLNGYETWQKTMDIKAGTLTWLNYARLVPKDRPVVALQSYTDLHASLGTVDGQTILIQQDASQPSFQLVDVRADNIKTTTITLPASLYSDATTPGVTHTFSVDRWDASGRYLIVEHSYGDKKEWLVVDTQDLNSSKNISRLLDIGISYITFSGTGGDTFYALTGSDIRKLDLSAGTISRSLVSKVTSFELYDTNVITYVGTDPTDATKRVVGLYRDGDNNPHILRSYTESADVPLHIATTRYFNENYVAITNGSKVEILTGNYPSSSSVSTNSLSEYDSFTFTPGVDRVSFSPTGFYLLVQSGAHFASYDIEYKTVANGVIATDSSVAVAPLKWLDNDHLWSDYAGRLSMRDFDGLNAININTVATGYDVTLTNNERYLYSIGKTSTGYQLQRVRLILQ